MEHYKALYSKYIEHAVELHNYHQVFINNVGEESGQSVRSNIRNMIRLEKELQKASLAAYQEHKQNNRDRRQRLREERAYRKANPLKRGRKPNKEK